MDQQLVLIFTKGLMTSSPDLSPESIQAPLWPLFSGSPDLQISRSANHSVTIALVAMVLRVSATRRQPDPDSNIVVQDPICILRRDSFPPHSPHPHHLAHLIPAISSTSHATPKQYLATREVRQVLSNICLHTFFTCILR